jgi:hypothetical protein
MTHSKYIHDEMEGLQLLCIEYTCINSVYSSVHLKMFQVH